MPPSNTATKRKLNILSLIHSTLFLLFLHSGEVTGHLTYLEAMTSQDEMEPRQLEDFYQDYQDDPEYHEDQKLDLDSLQDILDYSVEVESSEEEEGFKLKVEKVEESQDPSIRQFAFMISRMLYQLAQM